MTINQASKAAIAACWSALLLPPSIAWACDIDDDCGEGGVCIKREKRARGICYGRTEDTAPPPSSAANAVPRPVSGERRQRATEMLGDPEQMLRDNLPGQETGAVCMLNQDCDAGRECVIAGFEGRCIKL